MGNPASTSMIHTNKNSCDAATYISLPVIIKFLHVFVGIVCVGIAAYDLIANFQVLTFRSGVVTVGGVLSNSLGPIADVWNKIGPYIPLINLNHITKAFKDQMTCRVLFLSVSGVFLVISLIQLTWFPKSLFRGAIKSRIISGVIYHLISFGLLLASSLYLRDRMDHFADSFIDFKMMQIAMNMGLANAGLYILSALLALWSFVQDKIMRKDDPYLSEIMLHTPPKYEP